MNHKGGHLPELQNHTVILLLCLLPVHHLSLVWYISERLHVGGSKRLIHV